METLVFLARRTDVVKITYLQHYNHLLKLKNTKKYNYSTKLTKTLGCLCMGTTQQQFINKEIIRNV